MALLRAKIRWNIPGAGISHSVLHFASIGGSGMSQAHADEIQGKIDTFLSQVRQYLPNQVSVQAPAEIEEIASDSGQLIQVFAVTQPGSMGGQAASASRWAAPTGGVISWSTGTIRNGRRVRGRTFLVPLSSEAFANDGTLDGTALSLFNTAAAGLRAPGANARLSLWGRPSAPNATDGVQADVTGHRVPDMAAILTSRRS